MGRKTKAQLLEPMPTRPPKVTVRDSTDVERLMDKLVKQVMSMKEKYDESTYQYIDRTDLQKTARELQYAIALEQCGNTIRRP